jgi:serine/threonine protein kinase/tetratricopeptide (TPR) repeat protein
MPSPDSILDLLERWEEQYEQGRDLSPAELAPAAPALWDELARRLGRRRQLLGLVASFPALDAPTVPALTASGNLPAVPGYEVLEEIGRGGMGVVYKARQLGLERLVALKMILGASAAGPQQRARFQIEAEALARVRHPNVVQVHAFGTHEGQPYFALEYIPGGSLAHHLAGRPLLPAAAAALVEPLARAVAVLHAEGIVHRDLKPANVLLSFSRDAQRSAEASALRSALRLNDYVPKITDFGLARLGDAGTTTSGALLGTPSYMAPEQARGPGQVGPAADVYALGAILYECLTGRPPFRAATVIETLEQVHHHEPVAVRSLAPAVPRDLETICHKCLEKLPASRYASAVELADDLRRFLDGEPVRARPLGRLARVWRWCRRNPRVAGLLAALVLVFVGGFAGVTAMGLAAWSQKIEADRQRARAEDRQRLARNALGDLTRVAERLLDTQPRMTLVQLEVLERALASYQELAQEDSQDPELRYRTSQAYHFVARMCSRLGRPKRAEQSLRAQLALLEELAAEDPAERKYRFDLFHCRMALGMALGGQNRLRESEEQSQLALNLIRDLVRNFPNEPFYRDALAHQTGMVAAALLGRGEVRRAEELHREGLAVARALVKEFPPRREHPLYERNVMFNLKGLGGILVHQGRKVEAEPFYRESVEIAVELARRLPNDLFVCGDVPLDQMHLAALLIELGRRSEAESLYRDALTRAERVVQDQPNVLLYRGFVPRLYLSLAELHFAAGQTSQAEKEYRRAVELYAKLVEDFPTATDAVGLLKHLLTSCPVESVRDPARARRLAR